MTSGYSPEINPEASPSFFPLPHTSNGACIPHASRARQTRSIKNQEPLQGLGQGLGLGLGLGDVWRTLFVDLPVALLRAWSRGLLPLPFVGSPTFAKSSAQRPRCSRCHVPRDLAAMADFEEMVPSPLSPLSPEEEDGLWFGESMDGEFGNLGTGRRKLTMMAV